MHAPDRDVSQMDAEFPERSKLKGDREVQVRRRARCSIAAVPGQVADIEAMLDEVQPDVIVAEPGMAAAARVIEQRHGIPWATCNISAFAMRSGDTAPSASGSIGRARGLLGRLRDRALNAGPSTRPSTARSTATTTRRAPVWAWRATAGGLFDETLSPYLYLQPTVPSFEYPRSDLAPQVHFVGPLLPPVPGRPSTLPAWWDESSPIRGRSCSSRRARSPPTLASPCAPSLEALRDEPVQVIAVTGGPDPAAMPRAARRPRRALRAVRRTDAARRGR